MNPRKGLKRVGFRRYLVEGPKGVLAVDRDTAYRWFVQPPDWPRCGHAFFAQEFRRLADARAYAEARVGIDYWPDDMPVFLRRAKFERRAT